MTPALNEGGSEPTSRGDRSVAGRVIAALFFTYKAVTANRRPACRFVPSCSEYAATALDRFGPRRSLPLIAARLLRCRPGGPFGWDPVPDELSKSRYRLGRRARAMLHLRGTSSPQSGPGRHRGQEQVVGTLGGDQP